MVKESILISNNCILSADVYFIPARPIVTTAVFKHGSVARCQANNHGSEYSSPLSLYSSRVPFPQYPFLVFDTVSRCCREQVRRLYRIDALDSVAILAQASAATKSFAHWPRRFIANQELSQNEAEAKQMTMSVHADCTVTSAKVTSAMTNFHVVTPNKQPSARACIDVKCQT